MSLNILSELFAVPDDCRLHGQHGPDVMECVSDCDKSSPGRVLCHKTTTVPSEDRVHCQPTGSQHTAPTTGYGGVAGVVRVAHGFRVITWF